MSAAAGRPVTPSEVYEHLLQVLTSERFLLMQGLNNELPFYICDFPAARANEMLRVADQLVTKLATTRVDCLGDRGVRILQLNLYDLSVRLLQEREGSSPGSSLWDSLLGMEPELSRSDLLETLQNVLGVQEHLVPAISRELAAVDHDVLFLTGIGEVFPYIRSHNVLNNLQTAAKAKPTVLFFPGEYRHSTERGTSLELFGLLRDDRYYRAFNIFDVHV